MYLKVGLEKRAALLSLDKEDFINKVRFKNLPIGICHARTPGAWCTPGVMQVNLHVNEPFNKVYLG